MNVRLVSAARDRRLKSGKERRRGRFKRTVGRCRDSGVGVVWVWGGQGPGAGQAEYWNSILAFPGRWAQARPNNSPNSLPSLLPRVGTGLNVIVALTYASTTFVIKSTRVLNVNVTLSSVTVVLPGIASDQQTTDHRPQIRPDPIHSSAVSSSPGSQWLSLTCLDLLRSTLGKTAGC